MKRPYLLIFLILLLSVLITLILQNGETIQVDFLIWNFAPNISVFSLIMFSIGFLGSTIFFFPMWLRKRNEVKNLLKDISLLTQTEPKGETPSNSEVQTNEK